MDPNCPWAVKPQLDKGNRSPDPIYAAVGRALSQWEVLEGLLAAMFGLFVGAEYTAGAQAAYGTVIGFQSRRAMLETAYKNSAVRDAEAVRLLKPFPDFLRRVAHFSARRNDIAHGFVCGFRVDKVDHGYFLVPASYNTNKRSKWTARGRGDYSYTASQIDEYTKEFRALLKEAGPLLTALSVETERVRIERAPYYYKPGVSA